MVRAAEGHAAKRGGLGSRRWADIRLAASLVCEKGVMLKIHGVEVCPLLPERAGRAWLSFDKEDSKQANGHSRHQGRKPRDTVGKPSARDLQRQERSARRLLKFQEFKCSWSSICQRLLHQDRAKLRDQVWTGWMRSRPKSSAPPTPAPVPTVVLAPSPGMRVRIAGVQARQLSELDTNFDAQAGRVGDNFLS